MNNSTDGTGIYAYYVSLVGETTRVISRGDYDRGKGDRVPLEVLMDVGSCAVRRLSGASHAGSAATERSVIILAVTPLGDSHSQIDYLADGGGNDPFNVDSRTELCDADGFLILYREGEEPGEVSPDEWGYFIRLGQPPVELVARLQLPEATMAEELLAAAAA